MLIKNAFLLDANGLRKADIRFNDYITEIKKHLKAERGEEVRDYKNKLIIPGFYNTHTHIAMSFLRNLGEDMELHEWLSSIIWPKEREAIKKKDLFYYSSIISIAESLKSGIVAINDMYFKMEEIAKACEDIGFFGVLSYGIIKAKFEQGLKETKQFYNAFKNSEYVKPGVAVHSIYSASLELIKEALAFAKEHNLIFHMHVAETRKEVYDCLKKYKKRPFELLNEINAVYENAIFAHASWVTKKEIKIVGDKKASVSYNPTSNLKLATGGIMPFEEYNKAHANVTIGTDGNASNNSLDFFEAMKTSSLLQKHKYWDATAGNAKLIFKAATINGAKALHINGGLLKEGMLANIVILDLDVNMLPLDNGFSSLIYAGKPYNVYEVYIKGKLKYSRERGYSFNNLLKKAIKKLNKFWENKL